MLSDAAVSFAVIWNHVAGLTFGLPAKAFDAYSVKWRDSASYVLFVIAECAF